MSSPSATASAVHGSGLTPPALPELRKKLVAPAAAPQPPVRPAQQPAPRTPRDMGKAAPALWQNLRPAPKAAAPSRRPDPAEAARAEAEALLSQARADAELLKAKAQKRAEAEGHVRGKAQARVELRRMMREARAILQDVQALRAQALDRLGDDVVETAVALARAVIGRRADEGCEDLRELAQRLLAEARDPRRLRANPADAAALEGLGVPVAPEAGIARGGFILLAADGERDARLETRIARLEAALKAGDGQ